MWIEPDTLGPVIAILESSGYEPFSSPGDRHGSWEWPFFKEYGGMTRFVILAATPVEPDVLDVELWIGAEADQWFTRQRVEALHVNPKEVAFLAKSLSARVAQAVSKANALGWSDLTESNVLGSQAVSARHV
jgi:hypothetical protein